MILTHDEVGSIRLVWLTDAHIQGTAEDLRVKRYQSVIDQLPNLKPDIVIDTGDVIDSAKHDTTLDVNKQLAKWLPMWQSINYRKELALGNRCKESFTSEEWISILGRTNNTEVANNKLNSMTTIRNGRMAVKFIVFEYSANKTHAINLIKAEIANATENIVCVISHSAAAWETILPDAVNQANRPDLKVYHFFGHYHPKDFNMYAPYPTCPNLSGYCMRPLGFFDKPRFAVMNFFPDGTFINRTVTFPF